MFYFISNERNTEPINNTDEQKRKDDQKGLASTVANRRKMSLASLVPLQGDHDLTSKFSLAPPPTQNLEKKNGKEK